MARKEGVKINEQTNFTLIGVAAGAVHQGIAALVKPVWKESMDQLLATDKANKGLFVACDQVTDPQNLGAIIRSCAAFGAKGVILPERSSAKITGTVVKASAGTIVHVKVCVVKNLVKALMAIRQKGIMVIGLAAEGRHKIWSHDLTGPLVFVAGAEDKGLRHLVKKSCHKLLNIPCAPKIESLNVSSAVSVALYEAARQRESASKLF